MTASEPSSPGAAPLSNDSREPGLWLWQGGEAPPHSDAPPPASPARPPSRVERIADFVGSAARWARRMGPASGWFLIGLAAFVMAHALPGGEPMPRNMPAAAPQPVPAPSAALPASSTSPAGVPVAQLGQLSEPSGCNCQKDGRTKPTHTSQMASIAQVAARRKKGVPFPRLPVGTGVSGALPLSMRRRAGGNDMARRRLLIWQLRGHRWARVRLRVRQSSSPVCRRYPEMAGPFPGDRSSTV